MAFKSFCISTFTFLLLIVSPNSKLSAQYQELQDDPSITWIAEFTTDYSFSLNANSTQEIIKLIKLQDDPSTLSDYNRTDWIINWIYSNAISDKYDCFKDPGLTKKLSKKNLRNLTSSTDTIVTFNPDSYEEVVQIVSYELSVNQFAGLRTNQVIYYNANTGDFQTKLISVAPLMAYEDGAMPVSYKKSKIPRPLFWIKMNQGTASHSDLESSDITWGALAYSKAHPLELNFIEIVKNTGNFNFREHIIQQATQQEKPVEGNEYGSNQFLDEIQIANMSSSVDTVITFDPETFEEEIMIVRNNLDVNEISQFRLVQEWYYDSKKMNLMNRLKAIAPMVTIKDENGKYNFSKPLYYLRYN